MKRIGAIAVAAIALVSTASVVSAQLPGVPYGPVETGTGLSLAADYGQPDNDLGGGSGYGLTGGFGFSRFGISASVGARELDGFNSQTSYGGRIGMRVFGGGLSPVSVGIQVGGASTKYPGTAGFETTTAVLPAAWVKVTPPLFPIKPWGQVYYVTGDNIDDEEARFVIGANLNLLLGFGFHAAYDWGDSGATWGVGAHFTFRTPGVPGV